MSPVSKLLSMALLCGIGAALILPATAFTIKVVNAGSVYNEYKIVTN